MGGMDLIRYTRILDAVTAQPDCDALKQQGYGKLPSKAHASCLRSVSALAGARKDQVAFEFGETAKHGEHQPAVWRSGIAPGITQRLEARASFSDSGEGVE
jgi:hypothetical protein